MCSENFMLTPKDFEREGGSRWHDHKLLHKKPVSQFAGPDLEKVKFSIILSAMHGINPEFQLKRLREIRDDGILLPLVINYQPITNNFWRLDSLREGKNYFSGSGNLIRSEADLTLTEYDDSNNVEAEFNLLYRVLGAIR